VNDPTHAPAHTAAETTPVLNKERLNTNKNPIRNVILSHLVIDLSYHKYIHISI
jgi:hypothetical protein